MNKVQYFEVHEKNINGNELKFLWVALYYDAHPLHTSSLLKNILYILGKYKKNMWNAVAAKIK